MYMDKDQVKSELFNLGVFVFFCHKVVWFERQYKILGGAPE